MNSKLVYVKMDFLVRHFVLGLSFLSKLIVNMGFIVVYRTKLEVDFPVYSTFSLDFSDYHLEFSLLSNVTHSFSLK